MGSIRIIKCTQKKTCACMYVRVHKPVKTYTILLYTHWPPHCDTHRHMHSLKPQYFYKPTIQPPPHPPDTHTHGLCTAFWNSLWLIIFSLKSLLKWFSRNTWTAQRMGVLVLLLAGGTKKTTWNDLKTKQVGKDDSETRCIREGYFCYLDL